MMSEDGYSDLARRKCQACEGGVEPLSKTEAARAALALDGWSISEDGRYVEKTLRLKDFVEAVELVHRIAAVAESEQHHPDLHLTGYRNLKVELTTHAIGGLSINDFILAAKIDELLKLNH